MTRYERLLSEYEENILVEERPMRNDGLYADGIVWIKKTLTETEKACILAEEIGHYETSCGDILDQSDLGNIKQEQRARKWAYQKLVPLEDITRALRAGHYESYDIAEYLGVEEGFLKECLKAYGWS